MGSGLGSGLGFGCGDLGCANSHPGANHAVCVSLVFLLGVRVRVRVRVRVLGLGFVC